MLFENKISVNSFEQAAKHCHGAERRPLYATIIWLFRLIIQQKTDIVLPQLLLYEWEQRDCI